MREWKWNLVHWSQLIPPLAALWGVLFDRKDCYLNLCGAKNGEATQNEDIITFPSKREFNFVNKIAQTMKWTKSTEICGSCCHRPINHSILDVCQSIHTNALKFVIKFCSLGTNIQVYMYFVVPDDNFNDYLRMQSHVTKDGNLQEFHH